MKFATGSAIVSSTANTSGILAGWATFDDVTWAVTETAGPSAITGLSTFTSDTWAAGNNTDVTLAGADPASDSTTHSLRFNEAGAKTLNLTEMKSDRFERYGQQIGSGEAAALLREILNVEKNADGNYTLASKPGQLSLAAAQPTLPSGSVQDEIVTAILGSEFVPATAQNVSAANRLAKAMIEGAGDETRLVAELPAAIDIALGSIREFYNNLEPEFTNTVRMEDFKPIRANYRPVVTNRFADFSRSDAYSGWTKGLYPIAWFDSDPERACANILEGDDQVDVWVRLERGDTPVTWNAGVYQPDFYVRTTDGKNWMVEVKADKDLPLETVQRKKNAAEIWVNLVSDSGFGDWRYALIPESTVKNVNTFRQMCKGKR